MIESPSFDTILSIVTPKALWGQAQLSNFPAALWRLPKCGHKQFMWGNNPKPHTCKIDFEDLPTGFAMSPFLNPDGKETLFIESDVYLKFDARNRLVNRQNENQLFAKIETLRLDNSKVKHPKPSIKFSVSPEVGKSAFRNSVQNAISAIDAQQVQKVVLSRRKEIELPDDFSVIDAFDALCMTYPAAFVSLVYLPHLHQVWLGATPETLVSQDENGIFRTVSLAGTQPALDGNGDLISIKNAQWTQKEIEEQAFVSRYIIQCFKKIRVREYEEEGPKTVVAGNLMHLRTDYSVATKEINFPQLGTVMLELLHPTSAVCGMPKAPALDFILANEGYNREFYSGFLGPINVENATNLFVNLRCMKIEANCGTLYAGAGITEDSDPEREFIETELKTQTLLRVLEGIY